MKSELLHLLKRQRDLLREKRLLPLPDAMRIIDLKMKCRTKITKFDLAYLIVKEILTTVSRDEIEHGDKI